MTRAKAASTAYAAGLPLPAHVAEQASRWYVLFMTGTETPQDRRAWQAWRAADPDHERAWLHLELSGERLRSAGPAAYDALSRGASAGRRRVLLSLLAAGACTGPLLWYANRQRWLPGSPDYATLTGEQRLIRLDDGTQVLLNTASAIDVQYASAQRQIRLRHGEILVTTGHGPGHEGQPLIVVTAQGRIRPIGTRFSVRQEEGLSSVILLEGLLEIEAGGTVQRLHAGQRLQFSSSGMSAAQPAVDADSAWQRGELAADNLPLDIFLAELSRYRPGWISCDSRVAGLRISGLFPLRDTDQVLDAVGRLLPVSISRSTAYWVRVSAR